MLIKDVSNPVTGQSVTSPRSDEDTPLLRSNGQTTADSDTWQKPRYFLLIEIGKRTRAGILH